MLGFKTPPESEFGWAHIVSGGTVANLEALWVLAQRPHPIRSQQPIFTTVTLPRDGVTLNGEKYFTMSQISRHLGIGRNALHVAARAGRIRTVVRTGLLKKIKLVRQDELKRFQQS
jgi:hypothetical protein